MKFVINESQLNFLRRRTNTIDWDIENFLSQKVSEIGWVNPCKKYASVHNYYLGILDMVKDNVRFDLTDFQLNNMTDDEWDEIGYSVKNYIDSYWKEKIYKTYNVWCKELK
jgi:hypothetical protein